MRSTLLAGIAVTVAAVVIGLTAGRAYSIPTYQDCTYSKPCDPCDVFGTDEQGRIVVCKGNGTPVLWECYPSVPQASCKQAAKSFVCSGVTYSDQECKNRIGKRCKTGFYYSCK